MKGGYKILGSDIWQKAVCTLRFECLVKLYAFNRNILCQATGHSLGFTRTTLCCSPLLPASVQLTGTHFKYWAVSAVMN